MSHILIVDDEPDSCEFVSHFLKKQGYATRCVPNGREALEHLLRHGIEALVLDVRMPEMDGITLLEILRSYLRWQTLPVILVTAHATPEQLEKAKELGVYSIFEKSNFKLIDLLSCLRKVIPPASAQGGA
jgi:CheY-like chemotaxis protein